LKELNEFLNQVTKSDGLPILLMGIVANIRLKFPGDLNVNAIQDKESETLEYRQMMNTLNTPYFHSIDILKYLLGYHPPTVPTISSE
jgi:hypothetical protein